VICNNGSLTEMICSYDASYLLHLLQVTGKCGSVLVRLIPAPRGTGIVSAPVPKKLLHMAGIDDCYTAACGQTATLGNFGKFSTSYILCVIVLVGNTGSQYVHIIVYPGTLSLCKV